MSYAGIPSVSDTDYYMAPKRDVSHGMLRGVGLGAVMKQENLFCSPSVTTSSPLSSQVAAREMMRRYLAAAGVATYPGRPWTATEQNAWNAYNKQKGLQPMLFGKYPMGTQCKTLVNQYNTTPGGGSVAGFSGFGETATAVSSETPASVATPAANAVVIPPNLTTEEILAIKEAAEELGIPNPLETGDGSGTTVVVQPATSHTGLYLALAAGLGLAYYFSQEKKGGKSGKRGRR